MKEPKFKELLERMSEKMLFTGLREAQLSELAKIVKIRDYKDGERIFAERQYGDTLYIVDKGRVSIEVTLRDEITRKESSIVVDEIVAPENGSFCENGDFFGEMCLLDLEPRSATVVARGEARVWEINRDDLYWLFGHDKELQLRMLLTIARVLSRRLNAHAGPAPDDGELG